MSCAGRDDDVREYSDIVSLPRVEVTRQSRRTVDIEIDWAAGGESYLETVKDHNSNRP